MLDTLHIGLTEFKNGDTFEIVDFNGDFVALLRVVEIESRKGAIITLVEASDLFPAKIRRDIEAGYTMYVDASDVSGLYVVTDGNPPFTFGPFYLPVATDQELRDVVRKRAEELATAFNSAKRLGKQLEREFGLMYEEWVSAIADAAIKERGRIQKNPARSLLQSQRHGINDYEEGDTFELTRGSYGQLYDVGTFLIIQDTFDGMLVRLAGPLFAGVSEKFVRGTFEVLIANTVDPSIVILRDKDGIDYGPFDLV